MSYIPLRKLIHWTEDKRRPRIEIILCDAVNCAYTFVRTPGPRYCMFTFSSASSSLQRLKYFFTDQNTDFNTRVHTRRVQWLIKTACYRLIKIHIAYYTDPRHLWQNFQFSNDGKYLRPHSVRVNWNLLTRVRGKARVQKYSDAKPQCYRDFYKQVNISITHRSTYRSTIMRLYALKMLARITHQWKHKDTARNWG